MPPRRDSEQVVLLDPSGSAVGTCAKAEVHHGRTPLHLAFSCYVFDPQAQLLVTRRATSKATFPGVWSNTVCGHPAPGEGLLAAARRRAVAELGLSLASVRLGLPRFAYTAQLHGVVENEMCPVLLATTGPGTALEPDPAEVDDAVWMPWAEVLASVASGDRRWSPWCADQVRQLDRMGPDPAAWPSGDPSTLPPAARL